MKMHMRRRIGVVSLAMLTLVYMAATSEAQCGKGQQQQNALRQQSGLQQQQIQQLLRMQQLNTLIALQQQQNGLIGLQQQPQSGLLYALRQQFQQNGLLIALDSKRRNSSKSARTARPAGLPTATQNQQFFTAVQSALQQTQDLLTALTQQNAIANQNVWENALRQQFSLLTGLSEKYGQQTAD